MSLIQKTSNLIVPELEMYSYSKNMSGPKLFTDIYPNEGSSLYGYNAASAQKQMSFTIGSNNAFWNANESFLEFDLKLNLGTTGGLVSGDVSALFNRVRLVAQNGVVLFDEQQSNLYQRIVQIATVSDNHKAQEWHSLGNNLGLGDSSMTAVTSTAIHVVLPLKQSIFKQVKMFPLPVLGNLRLILDMSPDSEAFCRLQATSHCYRVDNPRLACVMQPLENDYLEKIKRVAASGGLVLNYSQSYWASGPASQTSNTVTINYAMKSARKVIAVHRLSSQLADTTMDTLSKFQAPYGGLTNVQVRIGSDQFPTVAVDSTERCYAQMKKCLGTWNDIDAGAQITRTRYTAADNTSTDEALTGPLFIVGISLDKDGINTGASTVSGAMLYRFNNVTALAGLQADVFVVYDTIVVIKSPSDVYIDI